LYYVYRLNSYVSNLIQQRWALRISSQKRFDDILDLVLDAHQAEHGTSDSAIPLAQVRQIRDEFKTFMLAGHETSASMMTWALYEILANDDVRKQVTQEADRVLGGKRDWKQASAADLPSRERLDQLECAEACLKVREKNLISCHRFIVKKSL
jgi:cytochrome P450